MTKVAQRYGNPTRGQNAPNSCTCLGRSLSLRRYSLLLIAALGLAGCSSLRPKPDDQYVYVTAKQTYLRDRVAAVSNRTGTVENGERLKVLEHGRRFLRVKSDKGDSGWIDEKTIATQQTFDAFAGLGRDHAKDPTIASAVVRDEVWPERSPSLSRIEHLRAD